METQECSFKRALDNCVISEQLENGRQPKKKQIRKCSEKVLKWEPERKEMKTCCEKVLK